MLRVTGAGIIVTEQPNGLYRLEHWWSYFNQPHRGSDVYVSLTWSELLELAGTCLEETHPGDLHGPGFVQPALFRD